MSVLNNKDLLNLTDSQLRLLYNLELDIDSLDPSKFSSLINYLKNLKEGHITNYRRLQALINIEGFNRFMKG